MKKIFFTALIAVVAIGGAIAQGLYIINSGTMTEQIFICSLTGAGCFEFVGPRHVYLYSPETGVGDQVVDKTIFVDLELQLL